MVSSSSSGSDCSIDGALGSYGFSIYCNTTYDPPKPFLVSGRGKYEQFYALMGGTVEWDLEILSIDESEIRLKTWQTTICFDKFGTLLTSFKRFVFVDFTRSPFTFSNTKNRVFAVGCDTSGFIFMNDHVRNYTRQCDSVCDSRENVLDQAGSCTGSGCCQIEFPKGQTQFSGIGMSSFNHTQVWTFNPCSSIFMAEKDHYKFNPATDLLNPPRNISLIYKEGNKDVPIPVVLNWAIGNKTCEEAQKNLATFVCHQEYNSSCINSDNGLGYRCTCNKGYEGNPYFSPGCQDVNECEDPKNNPCEGDCTNVVGSYGCTCPKGSSGDGRKDGNGCTPNKEFPIIKVAVGTGVAFLSLIIVSSWLFLAIRKRKLAKLKDKFFLQNGGLQLQKQICSHENGVQSTQIFTAKELEKATNNYDKNLILGRGGFGTVYKGTLSDNRVVAIKKSKIVDQSQIEQFINEVVILTQVHHRNVVKLLGCCLETEVPLLVYEYVSNGPLSHHLYHKVNGFSSISWEGRLRIAAETASALGYLHSAAGVPVIHRDMKSANILLDENYTAKVSDFGASMLVPLDQTQVTTLVQGTIGYLDPEYFLTSQLTEKSDVYSFGVVLVELLTGEKPLLLDRSEEQRNFTTYYISSLGDRRMFELLDARVLNEGQEDQILIVAKLAERCLNMEGKNRPTMVEVAAELEGLRRMLDIQTPGINYRHPNHGDGNEKTNELEAGDLYPVPLTADPYMETNMTMSMNIPP
ncbi:wall-associated receptor kinase 2-like [Papaver somniferum]|nr:wall-associated receptor kinase 2-like [Papaver somniferum]